MEMRFSFAQTHFRFAPMWTMPRNVLRVVAVILAACAVGAFIFGVRGAPERARLPGESPGGGPALQATDARPLDDLVLTPSELEPEPPKVEEMPEETAEEEAPVIAPPPPAPSAAPAPKPAMPSSDEDRVGDLIDGLTPPPEQPPY
jgi:hypothetical protein